MYILRAGYAVVVGFQVVIVACHRAKWGSAKELLLYVPNIMRQLINRRRGAQI
jgi:hypothetical protein